MAVQMRVLMLDEELGAARTASKHYLPTLEGAIREDWKDMGGACHCCPSACRTPACHEWKDLRRRRSDATVNRN